MSSRPSFFLLISLLPLDRHLHHCFYRHPAQTLLAGQALLFSLPTRALVPIRFFSGVTGCMVGGIDYCSAATLTKSQMCTQMLSAASLFACLGTNHLRSFCLLPAYHGAWPRQPNGYQRCGFCHGECTGTCIPAAAISWAAFNWHHTSDRRAK